MVCVSAAQAQFVTDSRYTLTEISTSVSSSGIAQLAFNPNDDEHLYAVRTSGAVTRYDYDAATGDLSNGIDVATGLGSSSRTPLGLAFYNDDLFVSLQAPSSGSAREDSRLTRLSAPNAAGVFQERVDFVYDLPTISHGINQIQIVGDALYVGIGARGRTGDPAQENFYTMTVATIRDLGGIDFTSTGPSEFESDDNHLALTYNDWTDATAVDGMLRYYASGFRNPFGLAVDESGELWVSSNGNSDAGTLSPDFVYRNLSQGDQGLFPLESFGFPPPHIVGNPISSRNTFDLGQSPALTGFDFVPAGPDAGMVAIAQYGATREPEVGRDVLLLDPQNGATSILVDDLSGPTDVVADPMGRLLIADLNDGSIWLLTPPTLEGDYNGDGAVDAADYTVWRDSEGLSGPGLAADGNGDGQVDGLDYNLWVANFGDTWENASLAVPEPSALFVLAPMASATLLSLRQRRSR